MRRGADHFKAVFWTRVTPNANCCDRDAAELLALHTTVRAWRAEKNGH